MNKSYEVIVIGSGHAGCEACLASARMGRATLLLTLNLDSIAFLACNPSIGGTAKGHLVCEIDALGGQMGINADKTTIQRRMLNSSKGPAVQSLRAQTDKVDYHTQMKKTLEDTPNLSIRQAEASEIIVKDSKVVGVKTKQGEIFDTKAVVVATGVYLNSKIIVGEYTNNVGPNGFAPANELTKSLIDLGITIRRFKTGTPVRVHGDSIEYNILEKQFGEDNIQSFSFMTTKKPKNKALCYLTYTTAKTHEIILNNLDQSPLYNGLIESLGPRYCPSIETKVMRFKDKDRHQLFLEPEALSTKEVYIQGLSTSFPVNIQEQMVHSIPGLEHAHIMRDAYAIEYDCIDSLQLDASLALKKIKGLYFAGQVNGTSGYEEAGAQGIIAGINASRYCTNDTPFILKRSDAYIGVLIDDLVTKGTNEPYRMMTSRAEYRLYLRQDNADMRLTQMGYDIGLVTSSRYKRFLKKKKIMEDCYKTLSAYVSPDKKLQTLLTDKGETIPQSGIKLSDLLKRNSIHIEDIVETYDILKEVDLSILKTVEIQIKYEGYLAKQDVAIAQAKNQESILIPDTINYFDIRGLRIEAQQKLDLIRPKNLGQAGRISGVSPADISVLTVYLKSQNKKVK